MIAQLLGEAAAGADPLISGKWLLDAIPVLASAAVVIFGRNYFRSQGAKDAQSNDVTIKKPVPIIETREKPVYALKVDVEAALGRFQESHNKCQRFQEGQHAANQKRLDDQVQALARMEGMVASVQQTVTTLLDLALNRKTNSRA